MKPLGTAPSEAIFSSVRVANVFSTITFWYFGAGWAVLCGAVLFCAVLCCAVLCCAALLCDVIVLFSSLVHLALLCARTPGRRLLLRVRGLGRPGG